jgi:hypothetical protein
MENEMENLFDKDRFSLEQEIMDCWGITRDLDYVLKMLDTDYTEDDLANVIIGLRVLYEQKFDTMFATFEKLIRDRKIM